MKCTGNGLNIFADECSGEEKYTEDINYENFLQLLVPEGRVVALSKADFSQVSWEHKVCDESKVYYSPFRNKFSALKFCKQQVSVRNC